MNFYKKYWALGIVILNFFACYYSASAISTMPNPQGNTIKASSSASTTKESTQKNTPCLPRYGELNEFLHLYPPAMLWWINSADFNDDGFPDILLSRGVFQSGRAFEIDILLNDGKGSFKVGTSDVFLGDVPKVVEPREVILADFNGDDRIDIFFADQGMDTDPFPGYQNTLVLSAPGGKMIDATSNLPQQSDQTHSATTADIDGDGDNDLFIGNLGGGGVSPQIWLNDGTGTFTIANEILPDEQTDLMKNWYTTSLFADINNDGYADLILGQGDIGRDSHVLLNDGTGHFTRVTNPLPTSFFAPQQGPVDIKAGDIDEDGLLDLLIVDTRNTNIGWYIQVLINNGDGTFRDETESRLPQSGYNSPWMWRVCLIDFNMDGHLDIVACPTEGSKGPLFYKNNGEGCFTKQSNIFNIEDTNLWTFLDINRDGLLDVFWSYSKNGSLPEIHFTVMALGCP